MLDIFSLDCLRANLNQANTTRMVYQSFMWALVQQSLGAQLDTVAKDILHPRLVRNSILLTQSQRMINSNMLQFSVVRSSDLFGHNRSLRQQRKNLHVQLSKNLYFSRGLWRNRQFLNFALKEVLAHWRSIIFRGTGAEIPEKIRNQVIKLVCEGDPGIVKSNQRCREFI